MLLILYYFYDHIYIYVMMLIFLQLKEHGNSITIINTYKSYITSIIALYLIY